MHDTQRPPPMTGFVNGVIGSIALWALIGGIVFVAS